MPTPRAPTLAALLWILACGGEAARAEELRAVMTLDASLPTHTLYRPADLTAAPGRWPVVLWANGECLNLGNRYRGFLSAIAAAGYVVIAIGPIGAPQVESQRELTPAEGGRGPDRKSASRWTQLTDALAWAQAAAARPGSAYFRRLDLQHVAVMGQACGGMQALSLAGDPRITTTVLWNSGTLPAGSPKLDGTDADRQSLARLRGSVALVSGDESDVAYRNAEADFAALPPLLALRAVARGVGHQGSFLDSGGGVFTPLAIAWLDWQLKGRARAARQFTGPDCGLCRDGRWALRLSYPN